MEREKLRQLVKSYAGRNETFHFKLPEELKPGQIENAIRKYAKDVRKNDVVALMDTTLFGNGKNGYLLTEHKIYHNLLKRSYDIDGIVSYYPKENANALILQYKNGEELEFHISVFPELEDLIRRIIFEARKEEEQPGKGPETEQIEEELFVEDLTVKEEEEETDVCSADAEYAEYAEYAEETVRRAEEEVRAAEEEWRAAEAEVEAARREVERAKRRAEEAARALKEAERAAEEKRRAEEAARAAEEKRRAEEAARAAEEKRRAEEAARAAEEKRRAEEAARAAEEKRRAEEAAQAAEEKRRAEEAEAMEVPWKEIRERLYDQKKRGRHMAFYLRPGMVIRHQGKKYLIEEISSMARAKKLPYDILNLRDIEHKGQFVWHEGIAIVSQRRDEYAEILNYTKFNLSSLGNRIMDIRYVTQFDRRTFTYLYYEDGQFYFMDMDTFDMLTLEESVVPDSLCGLKKNDEVVVTYGGRIPFWVEKA